MKQNLNNFPKNKTFWNFNRLLNDGKILKISEDLPKFLQNKKLSHIRKKNNSSLRLESLLTMNSPLEIKNKINTKNDTESDFKIQNNKLLRHCSMTVETNIEKLNNNSRKLSMENVCIKPLFNQSPKNNNSLKNKMNNQNFENNLTKKNEKSFKLDLTEAKKDFLENNEKSEEIFLETSTREIIKNKENLFNYLLTLNESNEIIQHRKIIEVLKKINKSDLMNYSENNNEKTIKLFHINKDTSHNNKVKSHHIFSVNEVLTSKNSGLINQGKTIELESKANKYNVKNKRITLKNVINTEEWKSQHIESLLDHEDRKKIERKKSLKKTYYNKWYLPTKYWKIERKEINNLLENTPLRDEEFYYYNLPNKRQNQLNPFINVNEDAYNIRYKVFQEKFKKNLYVAKYIKNLEKKNFRIPVYLKKVPL